MRESWQVNNLTCAASVFKEGTIMFSRWFEWGRGVRMSVVSSNFITLSVEIFDLCRLSVNLSYFFVASR